MDKVNAVYQQKWPGYFTLILGLVAAVVGIKAHGEGGSDIRYVGLWFGLTGYTRISHQAIAARLRIAYRYGRTVKDSSGPVLVPFPRREEADR